VPVKLLEVHTSSFLRVMLTTQTVIAGPRGFLERENTVPSQVPNFDNETIAHLAMELYGIEGEISSFVSYEDQNARIKTSSDSYVLKIANKRWVIEELHMQIEALEHLRATAPELSVPHVIVTQSGDAITVVDGFAVRLFTFLEGNILADAQRSPELYSDIGCFMGRFSRAMQGYAHPAAHRPDDLWNLDNVRACKAYLKDVADRDVRARIERFYGIYEEDVLPKLQYLRSSVIHSDANEQNLLVADDRPTKIAGLIDFGDMQLGTHINELAITLAYALLGEDHIESAAREIVQGYTEEFVLEAGELDVLFNLMAMRLVQNIIMTSHSAKKFPDNEYIVISQKPARALLKVLEGWKWDVSHD
jgi:Ser/Thr protein kinase RdoA (MazF antagonist)